MKLYNTLTRKVEGLKPLAAPTVTVYTCGPTVYDYPHVGNWFTFIRYDLLIRTLTAHGYQPKWVMNITDVGHLVSDADEGEDKLERGARRDGKTAWDVAKLYTNNFMQGLTDLDCITPDYLPKATDHIPEQIALIQKLEQRGLTYTINDGVYYDTAKFPNYAELARLDVDEQQAGKRVSFNPQKHNPSDFALWKFSPINRHRDMEWDSPWGKGFPGWHIECSAIAMKYLGETIDIHSGGIDHIPVHHTNEIAQSQGASGKPLAHYWMHTNHLLIDGEKIAKSIGNSITLTDITDQGYSLEAFRLLVLESHYRTQSKFSWEALGAAQNRLRRIQNIISLRHQLAPPTEYDQSTSIEHNAADILAAMGDDLNTPQALVVFESALDKFEELGVSDVAQHSFEQWLKLVDNLFGLQLEATTPDISAKQKQLIAQRQTARQRSDFEASDQLRDRLSQQGIGLNDKPHGSIWYRL